MSFSTRSCVDTVMCEWRDDECIQRQAPLDDNEDKNKGNNNMSTYKYLVTGISRNVKMFVVYVFPSLKISAHQKCIFLKDQLIIHFMVFILLIICQM